MEEEEINGVYRRTYDDPYTITDPKSKKPLRLLFAQMNKIFQACSRPANEEKEKEDILDGRGHLDMAIILPGNMHEHGQSTDAQFLPKLAVNTQKICNEFGLNFKVTSRVSWECDDRTLGREINEDLTLHQEEDLVKFFCEEAKKSGKVVDKNDCVRLMKNRQLYLYKESQQILAKKNLIVVGSPNVNQVMANVCNVLLTNYKTHEELGMYLFPAIGTSPLTLCRYNLSGKLEQYREKEWDHRNYGWVHMIRNPWSDKNRPRFLIYVGGFYAQGVIAAMRKRVKISSTLVNALLVQKPAGNTQQILQIKDNVAMTDYKYKTLEAAGGNLEDCFIPAHIVKAKVEMPFHWFLHARPDPEKQKWATTRPSFEGNFEGFETVL